MEKESFHFSCYIIFLLTLVASPSLASTQPLCHEDERSALLEFQTTFFTIKHPCCSYATLDEQAKIEFWNASSSGSDCCSWAGVECDKVSGHVIGLDLSCTCLSGEINSSTGFFRLLRLRSLNLAYNQFNCQIPPAFGNLTQLLHLDLSVNLLFGTTMPLQNLTLLTHLDLSWNYRLNGTIPSNFGSMLKLEHLSLRGNEYRGEIPSSFGRLSHLKHLDLGGNSLTGKIPSSLGNLVRLTSLDLGSNQLTGEIPSFIGNLVQLTILDLGSNQLTGEIPSFIGNLVQLTILDLGSNQLTGEIPSSIRNLVQLTSLYFGSNQLIGKIPSSIGNLVQLTSLYFGSNQLTGEIPSSIGNLVQLTSLDLGSNQLTGEIPSSIGNLFQLTYINLNNNRLVEEIPPSFQNLPELRSLLLGSNQLSGEIPSLLGRLARLIYVDLSHNQFQGPVPRKIFQLQNLSILYLNSNNLNGTLKFGTISKAENLRQLVLSSNKLSIIAETNITNQYYSLGLGSCNLNSFPEFLQDQNDLRYLDLSHNLISGQVPKWFLNVSTENLNRLNLSGNFLTSFAQDPVVFIWKDLDEADLSSNHLRGSIPIPPPEIKYYFISNNMLSGGISPLICNLSFIVVMDMSDNHLTGFPPQCLSRLSGKLEVMNLKGNNLTGKIPELNETFCVLRMIDLSYNKLQGPLPRSLCNCSNLQFLNFANNQIRDAFPSWLGSLPKLEVLILRHNRFHGLIGESADRIDFPMLRIIDISQNSFNGCLPSKYFKYWTATKASEMNGPSYMGDCNVSIGTFGELFPFDYSMSIIAKGIQMNYSKIHKYLTSIDLSSNNFSGAIPMTIGRIKQLQLLNLSNNMLSGPLPPFLANLTNLEALDLSQNNLSGEIPQELTQLNSLGVFNVAYNHLTGPIPQSPHFTTFENKSYMGNSGLCGTPLSRKCGYLKAPPPQGDQDSGSAMKSEWKIVCMGFASGLVIGVVLGSCLVTERRAQRLVKKFGRRKQGRRR